MYGRRNCLSSQPGARKTGTTKPRMLAMTPSHTAGAYHLRYLFIPRPTFRAEFKNLRRDLGRPRPRVFDCSRSERLQVFDERALVLFAQLGAVARARVSLVAVARLTDDVDESL